MTANTTAAATAAATPLYPTALSPIAVGPLRLRNRIVMPAHTLLFGEGHLLSDRHIAYYRERAMGGTGLICAEGGAVHEESRGAFQFSISAYEARAIPQYAKLAAACHEHGAAVVTQLFSLGVHSSSASPPSCRSSWRGSTRSSSPGSPT